MHIRTNAIVCSVLSHGEHGAVVRLLTPEHGLLAGYVRGGRSRHNRPLLIPGNLVAADLRARAENQLSSLTVELKHSRAGLLAEPMAALGIEWGCVLTAASLPEGHPYPEIYSAFSGLLDAIEAAPTARGWAVALVRFECLLLSSLGFGLDLSVCAVTGNRDALSWVSPISGRAVSAVAGSGYEDRLLVLPSFMLAGEPAGWGDIVQGLAISGHFLRRELLIEKRESILPARERLVERFMRLA